MKRPEKQTAGRCQLLIGEGHSIPFFPRLLLGIFLLTLSFLIFVPEAEAIYDPFSVPNNRYGIHILDTPEIEKAASLVNSFGGDWGYVTIPIQANDRNLPKWTRFMEDCARLHLIPILRIASFPVGDHWMAPNEYDLVDFANFLDELSWPTKNRYVVIYNEPNHKNEWGGFVYPEEYARVLARAIDIFHQTNQDFFVISAGLDSSAPNGPDSLNEYDYLRIMNATVPGLFGKIDGFSSHSYGNPAFAAFPNIYSSTNIANYHFEENFLSIFGVVKPKLFLTEAGWNNDLIGDLSAQNFYRQAFTQIWTDDNIVAITPFVFNAPAGPWQNFSFLTSDGTFKPFATAIKSFPKPTGKPILSPENKEPKTTIRNIPPVASPKPELNIRILLQRVLRLLGI